jgi:hypothetical protein
MAVSSRLSDSPKGAVLLLYCATCTLPGVAFDDCVGTPTAALLVDVGEAGGGLALLGVAEATDSRGALLERARFAAGWILVFAVVEGAPAAELSGLVLGSDGLPGVCPLVCDSGRPLPVLLGVSELLVVTGAVDVGAPLEDDGGQVAVLLGCGRVPEGLVGGGQDCVCVCVTVCEPPLVAVDVAVWVRDRV